MPFIYQSKKTVVLDMHGVVPEEELYQGREKRSQFYESIERDIFAKSGLIIICVTNAMTRYYRQKHPSSNFKSIKYSIFPAHLKLPLQHHIPPKENEVNIVYAGSLHKWQNIDLMIQNIKNRLSNENFIFYILTGELQRMSKIIEDQIGDHKNIHLLSVSPDQLEKIYKKCHYGYVLRDDIIVNRVACPTKLIEYMYYGITPIVLSEQVGDFCDYDYEFVKLADLKDLKPKKSAKNISIIEKIANENIKIDLSKLLFNS